MSRSFATGFIRPKARITQLAINDIWVRPSDWPDISNPAWNTINLLLMDTVVGFKVTVASSGTYTVDWGDGTSSVDVNSNTLSTKLYTGGTGIPCIEGYTTHIVRITATNTITRFYVSSHGLISNTANGILDAEFGTAGLTSINDMFYYVTGYGSLLLRHCRFNQPCGGIVSASYGAFRRCHALASIEGLHNIYNAYDGSNWFFQNYALRSIDLSGMTMLADASGMFSSCTALTTVIFPKSGNLVVATSMFSGCTALTSIDVSSLTNILTVSSMFLGCTGLKSIDISVMTKMSDSVNMFSGCSQLAQITMPLTAADNFSAAGMFTDCFLLRSCNIFGWTMVSSTSLTFSGCMNLSSVIGMLSLTEVVTAASMFADCVSLISVDVTAMTKVTTCASMFGGCTALSTIIGTTYLGSAAASVLATAFLSSVDRLADAANYSGMKVTRFGAPGVSGFLNKITTLTLHASSTFSSTTTPQLALGYVTASAAQFDAIFAALPILIAAKTIDIGGSPGVNKGSASCAATAGSATFIRNPTTGYVVGKYLTGSTVNAGIACTLQGTGDTVTKNGHGLANNTPVVFSAIVTTTGISIKTIYYVVGTAANTFQLALAPGGDAIDLVGNGTGTFQFQQKIISVNPNVSFTCDNPSATTVTATMIATDCNIFLANARGWTVTA